MSNLDEFQKSFRQDLEKLTSRIRMLERHVIQPDLPEPQSDLLTELGALRWQVRDLQAELAQAHELARSKEEALKEANRELRDALLGRSERLW
jgi:hypothetical protein